MTPLDLTQQPPRGPREQLDGVTFLPRSIDKVRATLPGGNPGEYRIAGLTQMMLDMFDVPFAAFEQAVGAAVTDDVAAFLRARVVPAAFARPNASVAQREPRGGNRAEAIAHYPWLARRPEMILVLDVLEEDDRQFFAPLPRQ